MEEVKDVTAAVKLKRCVEGVSVGWVGGAARMAASSSIGTLSELNSALLKA
jgi:hypothetical protein